ncbi:hypothetical protein K438DRAFT_1561735 [Mycena galopus ATCC 62051]|nr:hypothetical protein K438DRAFT_1561735 [Mycena galopus ATCC 62051]
MEPELSLPLYSQSRLPSRPPPYSPVLPPPGYSEDPAGDEARIDISPRTHGRFLLPTGVWVKANGSTTVVLFAQERNIRVPLYRQHGPVRGSLIVEDTNQIREVVAKLEGRLEITTTDSGVQTVKVVKNTYCLWSSSLSNSVFPGTIDIACDFPATFQHEGRDFPLPPSYVARFPGFPTLFAKCTYSLTISITRERSLGFLSNTKSIYVPIEYNPHTVPARGMPPSMHFLASVKIIPEDWYQTSFVMNARDSNLSPIQCEAFIPSVKVFGLSDTIPLHLQLSGSLSSLRELIPPSPFGCHLRYSPVRVYLMRKVTFEYRGKSTWRFERIGEGLFPPLPLVVNFNCKCQPPCDSCDSCVETFGWGGEVKCNSTVTICGFQAAGLTVMDFITLEITPPNAALAPLASVRHAFPIRFVTETFVEPT